MAMTQRDMILRFMEENGAITPIDALREFGCMRLGARIFDLKRQGISIRTEIVADKNRYGETTHYAKYSLEGERNGGAN